MTAPAFAWTCAKCGGRNSDSTLICMACLSGMAQHLLTAAMVGGLLAFLLAVAVAL